MPSNTVSVLVCTHGADAWRDLAVRRAEPSARGQGALEVIVRHEVDTTLADCRNEAATWAHGAWLCFLDADDELAPGYLAAMHATLARLPDTLAVVPNVRTALLSPAVQHVYANGHETEPGLPGRGSPMDEVNHCVIGTLVDAAYFRAVGGFRADLPAYEDWELFLRLVRAGAWIVDVPDAVYRAWVTPTGRNAGGGDHAVLERAYRQIRGEHLAALGVPA